MAEITEIENKTNPPPINMDFIFCTEKKWSDFEKELMGIAIVE